MRRRPRTRRLVSPRRTLLRQRAVRVRHRRGSLPTLPGPCRPPERPAAAVAEGAHVEGHPPNRWVAFVSCLCCRRPVTGDVGASAAGGADLVAGGAALVVRRLVGAVGRALAVRVVTLSVVTLPVCGLGRRLGVVRLVRVGRGSLGRDLVTVVAVVL